MGLQLLNLEVADGFSAADAEKLSKRGRGRPRGSKKKREEAGSNLMAPSKTLVEIPVSHPDKSISFAEEFTNCSPNVVDQVGEAFRHGNRLAALIGMGIGSFVPLAGYLIVHLEVETRPGMWILVACEVIVSVLTVYEWAIQISRYALKALGLVILVEGTMLFTHVYWLGLIGLTILMLINGIAFAMSLLEKENES